MIAGSSPDAPHVSVVAALYNTGELLGELVGSLDAQTMPPSEFEVLLVDDGSTDDTLQRARDFAAARPNYRVTSIENSGWPGRPRNVGLDQARGEYVFFSDHDDRFGPAALQRMYDTARTNDADIVYGKIVRVGRPTPYWSVWAEDIADADPTGVVITSRTVHKLFRRALLEKCHARFREGRVRLEDHHFMAQVLPNAARISVLASTPCYWWIHREDGSNSSDLPVDPGDYWNHYEIAMRTWAEVAGPGPLLDAVRVSSITQALTRITPGSYAKWPELRREAVFDAIGDVVRAEFPPELDGRLSPLRRLRVEALRDGDRRRFSRLQAHRARMRFDVHTDAIRYVDDTAHVHVTARCRLPRGMRLRRDGDAALLTIGRRLRGGHATLPVEPAELGGIELTIRERTSRVEWPLRGEVVVEPGGLTVHADTVLGMTHTVFGDQLEPGRWDLFVRVQFLGESSHQRLAAVTPMPKPPRGAKRAYATTNGYLSFKIGK